MQAKLYRNSKLVGIANVPEGTKVIVVNDTRGHSPLAMDVYITKHSDTDFIYTDSEWIGLDEIRRG